MDVVKIQGRHRARTLTSKGERRDLRSGSCKSVHAFDNGWLIGIMAEENETGRLISMVIHAMPTFMLVTAAKAAKDAAAN
jgi:hypothetical protein